MRPEFSVLGRDNARQVERALQRIERGMGGTAEAETIARALDELEWRMMTCAEQVAGMAMGYTFDEFRRTTPHLSPDRNRTFYMLLAAKHLAPQDSEPEVFLKWILDSWEHCARHDKTAPDQPPPPHSHPGENRTRVRAAPGRAVAE